MTWKVCAPMDVRREFCELAMNEGANMAALCRRFGIARKTGYKWLKRFRRDGAAGLADRSRRPRRLRSPTPAGMTHAVLSVRAAHPAWGGRKIRRVLQRQVDHGALPDDTGVVPAASTITAILHRHDRINPAASTQRVAWRRFERARPNDLWQMDFKGDFRMNNGRRCHPLTMLDDHSRYNLCLRACGNMRRLTVQRRLIVTFERYGLPRAMLMDNGSPWASSGTGRWSRLTVWLLRLNVRVIHGRAYHPQTQGKEERFHRTLKAELLHGGSFDDLSDAQMQFDPWREVYNFERPHEALGLAAPASRYRVSDRVYPSTLPALCYGACDQVRRVDANGYVKFDGVWFWLSEAFAGERVGVRATLRDGCWQVFYCRTAVATLDVKAARDAGATRFAAGPPASARCARDRDRPGGEAADEDRVS